MTRQNFLDLGFEEISHNEFQLPLAQNKDIGSDWDTVTIIAHGKDLALLQITFEGVGDHGKKFASIALDGKLTFDRLWFLIAGINPKAEIITKLKKMIFEKFGKRPMIRL